LHGLAERLRTATTALHAAAERAGIMPALLAGRLGQAGYCALLRNLHGIYAALEGAIDRHATHPALAAAILPGLARRDALATDLRALHGDRWERLPVADATAAYVRRVRELDDRRPELLLAHAYVRYLGDLSGGQVLRRVVARAFALVDGIGVAFYDFGADPGALAARFRAALDALDADRALADEIVAEARAAFARHVDLFEELADARGPAQPPLA
jgi:heme oxygenase